MSIVIEPNLFLFATSELSQDAFICWFLSWAKPELSSIDGCLHKSAIQLIEAFFDKHGKQMPEIKTMELKRQVINKNGTIIDIIIKINEKIVVLIEDKRNTKERPGQLESYRQQLGNEGTYEEIIPIYFQTGDQSDYENVRNAGYQVISRFDFLKILYSCNSANNIFLDYRDHLPLDLPFSAFVEFEKAMQGAGYTRSELENQTCRNTRRDSIQDYEHTWTHPTHGTVLVQVRAKILPRKDGAYYTLESIHSLTNPDEKIILRSILPKFIPNLSACPKYKNPDGTNRTAFPRRTS